MPFSLLIKTRVLAGSESKYYCCLLLAWVSSDADYAHYWAIMPIKGNPGSWKIASLDCEPEFWSSATSVRKDWDTLLYIF